MSLNQWGQHLHIQWGADSQVSHSETSLTLNSETSPFNWDLCGSEPMITLHSVEIKYSYMDNTMSLKNIKLKVQIDLIWEYLKLGHIEPHFQSGTLFFLYKKS